MQKKIFYVQEDVKEDIAYKLQWENNTIHCIVVAYALKVFPSQEDSQMMG